MSRKKKYTINFYISILYRIITIICGFLLPKFLIPCFGSKVNGLVNSITQFLGIMVILESGVGAVVESALYKPIAKKNDEEISKIVKSSKKFFDKITLITIGCIVLLIIFYPYLVNSEFSFAYTASLIAILALGQLIRHYLFITYRILLNADQLLFINNAAQSICLILNTIITIILVKFNCSIHFIKLIASLVFLIHPFMVMIVVNKKYKIDLNITLNEEPIKQKWNGFAQHISSIILGSTDSVILTIFSTLENVSIYSIYYLVVYGIKQVLNSLLSGNQSLFGNMLANNEIKKLNKLFNCMEWVSHNIILMLYIMTGIMIIPFVMIYTKNFTDANYIVPSFGILITIAYTFLTFRLPYESLIKAAGHYKQTQTSSFIEAIINIIVSIILVFKFGLIGVAIGTLVAMLYRTIYLVWYLSKNILYRSSKPFFKYLFEDCIIIGLILLFSRYISLDSVNYIGFVIMGIKNMIICLSVTIVINILFNKKEISELKILLKNIRNK